MAAGATYINRLLSLAALMTLVFVTSAIPATVRAAPQAAIRLLEGGRDGPTYLAALEIVLEPGYLTYWRTPGDAGIPPVFDWSGSKNVAGVTVAWPAPKRMLEADSTVYAFEGKLLLPLRITPEKADAPVDLSLNLQYGICKDICIPTESTATLSLKGAGTNALTVLQAFEDLPKAVAMGDGAPFAFLSAKDNGPAGFTVTLRVPENEKSELFAEGPEGWIYSTSEAKAGSSPGTADFTIRLEASPAKQAATTPVRLTARAGTQAIETKFMPPRR